MRAVPALLQAAAMHTSEPSASPSAAVPADDLLAARLRLARAAGVGPRTARLLWERFGPPEDLLARDPEALRAEGVPRRIADALHAASLPAAAREELAFLRAEGCHVLGRGLPGYPAALDAIHDPPVVLAVRGALRAEDDGAVAVVGARRASPAGREVTHRLAGDLARRGVTVVSGLARGIDRAAHEGALAVGGRTVAVLGSGVRRLYPPAHRDLAARVAGAGAVLSEHHPDEGPSRHTFPRRNRIIAGLSLGVVVVQAGPRSGALITADFALQEGRELFAVPGCVLEPLAQGPNGLIKDGARLVETADDVLDVLFGVAHREGDVAAEEDDDAVEVRPEDDPDTARLLGSLHRTRPRSCEAIAAASQLSAPRTMTLLGRLELEGRVASGPAGYVAAPPR